MKYTFHLIILVFSLFLVQSCGEDPSGPDFSMAPPPFDTTNAISKTTSDDGLVIYKIEEGFGAFEVVSRDQVIVSFTGRTTDGEIFDSSFRNGTSTTSRFNNLTPVPISSGLGQISPLIDGFRRGLLGMKQGEKRTIVIPPELGYGDSQSGTNSFNLKDETLIFDVELVQIVSL